MAGLNKIKRNVCSIKLFVVLGIMWVMFYGSFKDNWFRIEKELSVERPKSNSSTNLSKYDELQGTRLCTQDERKDYLSNMCMDVMTSEDFTSKMCGNSKQGNGPCMLVDHANKIAFCEIRKSGSSSGVAMMLKHGPNGHLVPDEYHKGQVHEIELKERLGLKYETYSPFLTNYTKFMVVRHPFDRLISSFNDKMNIVDLSDKFKMHRLEIKYSYGSNRESIDTNQAFEEIPDVNVTFEEFMSMLLDPKPRAVSKDEHWSSYGLLCDPCRVHYDYIMRIESLNYDAVKFIKEVYNITGSKVPEINSYRRNKQRYFDLVLPKYLTKFPKTMSKLNISKLMEKYQYDFSLYGYQFNPKTGEATCKITTKTGSLCC